MSNPSEFPPDPFYDPPPAAKPTPADARWQKVEVPKAWRPKVPGDAIEGTYLGSSERAGPFGVYRVGFVRIGSESVYVSGSRLEQLLVSVTAGQRVRVVYRGTDQFTTNDGEVRSSRDFDLFVEMPR